MTLWPGLVEACGFVTPGELPDPSIVHARKEQFMLRWALAFLLIALVAGLLGFWALEGLAMCIAKVLFIVFLILFIISLVAGRRVPPAYPLDELSPLISMHHQTVRRYVCLHT